MDSAQRRGCFDGSIQLAPVLLIRKLRSFLTESGPCPLDHLVEVFTSQELPQQITKRDQTRHYLVFHDALNRHGRLTADFGNLFLQLLPAILQIIEKKRRALNLRKLA